MIMRTKEEYVKSGYSDKLIIRDLLCYIIKKHINHLNNASGKKAPVHIYYAIKYLLNVPEHSLTLEGKK